MDNEGGDWREKLLPCNRVSSKYQLDKMFPDRIQKPLEFDEINVDNSDWEKEPQEISRVKISYWAKKRIEHVE